MASNLKVLLSAVSVAALLASPALAKPQRQHTAPVPADAQASASPNASAVTVYAPDLKVQAHPTTSLNPDFQLSTDK